ncbi:Quorum-sensing regulator protein F [Chromobacterium violaceum]|uniref:Quorum-sensing regulator protein F n=1 Tax=Chromobacterium violaceum TaxID=536 RepID=A0A447TH28_CHRVL|nr:Quorum-sensing regulator protein F [Chromobacterium violaceum]
MKYLPILVVEDDADLREAIVDTLSLAGYPTLEAADGGSALQKLAQEPVGLIISDAQMAPMDGYDLFEEAKKRYPGVPFILMTAYGVIERAIELLRAGPRITCSSPSSRRACWPRWTSICWRCRETAAARWWLNPRRCASCSPWRAGWRRATPA